MKRADVARGPIFDMYGSILLPDSDEWSGQKEDFRIAEETLTEGVCVENSGGDGDGEEKSLVDTLREEEE